MSKLNQTFLKGKKGAWSSVYKPNVTNQIVNK